MNMLHIMNGEILSVRPRPGNPNANLWLNNGTWSVAYTVRLPDNTKKRIRQSLGTKDVKIARQRRQALFQRYSCPGCCSAKEKSAVSVHPFIASAYKVPVRLVPALPQYI